MGKPKVLAEKVDTPVFAIYSTAIMNSCRLFQGQMTPGGLGCLPYVVVDQGTWANVQGRTLSNSAVLFARAKVI